MTTKSIPTLLLVAALAVLPACDRVDDPEGLRTTPEGTVAPTSAPAQVRDPSASPTPAVADWRSWVAAEVERLRSQRADYFDQLMALPVRPTRAGFPRLTGPLVRDPDAAPILLHRLLTENEPVETRAALVEALPRTTGDYSAAAAELVTLETDARVRELLCAVLARAQAPWAIDGLEHGLADSDARVRAEALRSLGRRTTDAQELAPQIIAALSDADLVVQQEAARALGNLEVEAAKEALVARLGSPSADVRRHSLRALSRIDPAHARSLPQLEALRSDPDSKVARLAEQVAKEQ